MLRKKISKSLLEKFFLIGSFLYLISAVNNPFMDINFSSTGKIISTLRGVAPYVLMPILFAYFLFINKNLKFEWIYFLFLIYLFGQLIGYLINPLGYSYHINNQDQIYWLTCNLTACLYFYSIRDNKNFNILILKIFVLIITIITIKFLADVYIEFFLYIDEFDRVVNFFYNIHSMSPNKLLFNQPVPRSSGLSRMTIILFIFLYVQLFFVKKEKYKTILYTIIIGFLTLSLFNLQNRISVFYILILFLFTLFFRISNFNLKKKIIYALCIFIIPLVIHLNIKTITLSLIKTHKNLTTNKTIETIVSNKTEKETANKLEETANKLEEIEKNKKTEFISSIKKQRLFIKSSTGRKDLWNKTINLFFINKFIGYGPQADRDLLNQNVSSLYFYSMLCGGIISLLAIISITFILFFKSIKIILIKKIFTSKQIFTCFSLLSIGYLYLRTVVEISFGVFGIDMILFFITFNILRKSESY